MNENEKFLSDKEVSGILGISVSTLRRILRNQGAKKSGILKKAKPIMIGKRRRWNLQKLREFIGENNKENKQW